MPSSSSTPASCHTISVPLTRKIGGAPTFRWMSDASRLTPSRRISSMFTGQSFPPRPLCTRPTGPVTCRTGLRLEPELLAHARFDLRRHLGMLAQEVARVLAPLPDALAAVGVPRAGLLD